VALGIEGKVYIRVIEEEPYQELHTGNEQGNKDFQQIENTFFPKISFIHNILQSFVLRCYRLIRHYNSTKD
jgi:hypothetical protein